MSLQSFVKLSDGNSIPALGLGVWKASNEQLIPAIDTALEAGYRLFDTAAIYGNEEGVGNALHNSALSRSELFVTTKIWNDRHDDAEQALSESLKKLKLDYVDLYLIHWPAPKQDKFVNAWHQLISLKEQGLIRSIGVSNFNPHHIERLHKETGVYPVINQIELNPLMQQKDIIKWNSDHNIHTESWSPLSRGVDGIIHNDIISAIAEKYNKTVAQVVIRWHLDLGLIAIPKSVTPSRIIENFNVFDFKLDEDEISKIGSLDINQRLGRDPENFENI
ncbi:2,5-didehydrogluconate reductase DkgA [Yersinia sp. Marseille-Q3913]|uniref:2,5-didehydrogluconate reductase DkgA n=1 Tax=Yersinia sp. Marseille-Q3913 TaxID=2830769 RepID=UPI001BAEE2B2|nr:2,5-didehydrogluconate reductase DkgA [Yersinia sp. Marseille-Q3913]MBS0054864.1 2,5-didehydrogluconate reductase DkgA [Yersinia sp. Marseille-Q3913]